MAVPILDLQEPYRTIREEINSAIQGVREGGDFVLGPSVEVLEGAGGGLVLWLRPRRGRSLGD